eukprot:TRINITY_DN27939_c0_g2_i2.p1 TRINITY_DN27939_c0_g2~~TRINITY_DN27939_c0_g2_i2.p1  ORF type:complete len:637 (+),score=160.66 TRINITY_DN27939_c0_g2_i2:78-1913(+)
MLRSLVGSEMCIRDSLKVLQTVLSKISVLPRDRESLHAIIFGIITRGELDIVAVRMCLLSEGEARLRDQEFVLMYRATLFDTLKYVCELLNHAQVAMVLRLFCIHVLTVLSFRVPRLLSMLLSDVLTKQELDTNCVPEWRNIEWNLEESARRHFAAMSSTHAEFWAQDSSRRTSLHLDSDSLLLGGGTVRVGEGQQTVAGSSPWCNYEEMKMREEEEGHADEAFWWSAFWSKMLEEVPEEELEEQESRGSGKELFAPNAKWRRRMARRGECFCMLLQEWAAHVYNRNIALMQQPVWKSIHGYPILLKAFLLGMKTTPVERMSPQTFWCASSLLKNPSLIKIFTQVVLGQTSLHNTMGVMTALDEIGEWMSTLELTASSDPLAVTPYSTSFDWALLVKALALALSSDHFAVLSATIALIFNHIHNWPAGPRNVIVRELLFERYFLKLFGHWEAQVRRAFLRLVVYRFLRISNTAAIPSLGQGINKLYRDGICKVHSQYKSVSGSRDKHSVLHGLSGPMTISLPTANKSTLGKSFSAGSLSTLDHHFGQHRQLGHNKGLHKARSLSVENLCEMEAVSYTHLRAHETPEHLVCRLLLEKKKKEHYATHIRLYTN